jgi:hypothetical protein
MTYGDVRSKSGRLRQRVTERRITARQRLQSEQLAALLRPERDREE